MEARRDRLEDRFNFVTVKIREIFVVAVQMLEFLVELLLKPVRLCIVIAPAEIKDEGKLQKIVIEIVEEIFFQLRNVQLISEKVKEHVVDEVPENENKFK